MYSTHHLTLDIRNKLWYITVMKKRIVTTTIVVSTLIAGGVAMAINQPPEPVESVKPSVSNPVVEKPEVTNNGPASVPTPEPTIKIAPQTTPQPPQEPIAPQVDQACLDAKNAALAPLQAKIDKTNADAAAHRALGWTYRGTTTPMSEADLDAMIEMKFGPIFRYNQQQYDLEAAKHNC